jgi:signal transduction histidine kinase
MEYYLAWQYKEESTVCWEQVRASEKRVADYSMVADLTTRMIGAHDERTVILQMLDLYFLLFSPEKAGFLPFRDGVAGEVVSVPPGAYTAEQGQVPFSNPALQYQVAETGDGFRYRVMYGNQFIGILSINGVSIPGALNEYLNLTHFISRIAGLSITIARTYQDLERALAARDVEIVERKRAEGALQMAIRKLNMLSSITRHDILNQITGLRGYLGLSMRKIQDPAILEFVKKADKASESIQWQIEFTRNYQSIGEQAPKWQLVPAIISSAIRQLNPPGIGIKLTVQNWEVFADPLLEKVFYNLMENSLRHGDHVSCMEISAQETENGLAITYTDDGTGISEEDKKRLFQKGFGKHTGLGLFLSREILAITEITITETGEPGRGVQFVITVPKRGYRNTG